MKNQLPPEVMRANCKARRKRRIKAAKARGKWVIKKKFKIVSISSDEWDFSDCKSTREIVDSLDSYIDRRLKWNNVPTITFTDEHGKKRTASFSPRCGIMVEDAWEYEGSPDDF
jgi:hypothetical protein